MQAVVGVDANLSKGPGVDKLDCLLPAFGLLRSLHGVANLRYS
jgi:hypothetical protein